jgi:hypothetical protein
MTEHGGTNMIQDTTNFVLKLSKRLVENKAVYQLEEML